MRTTFILAMAIAVMAAPATSWGEAREVTVTCPDGRVVVQRVDCKPGQIISVQANCAGKKFLAQVQCAKVAPVSVGASRILRFQLGLVGSVSAFGRDVAGAGLLDLSLWVTIRDSWGLVLLGQVGGGNRPGTREAAFPYHLGLAFGTMGEWGRFAFGAKSIGFRGLGNESRAEGFAGLLRTDVRLAKAGRSDLVLTLEVSDGPAWRRGQLANAFGATAGLGFRF